MIVSSTKKDYYSNFVHLGRLHQLHNGNFISSNSIIQNTWTKAHIYWFNCTTNTHIWSFNFILSPLPSIWNYQASACCTCQVHWLRNLLAILARHYTVSEKVLPPDTDTDTSLHVITALQPILEIYALLSATIIQLRATPTWVCHITWIFTDLYMSSEHWL